jgi:dTDP-4-dehydrorhamnose 3,5-epimerase
VIFTETPLAGAWEVALEPIRDDRGFFARTFDAEEFRERGMDPAVVQCNTSWNERAGTVRGMHWQAEPHGEAKLVRCSRGAIFDVIVDVRPDSPSYCYWHGVELTPDNGRMLYIPEGFAHGFMSRADGSEVLYQMSTAFVPEAARGARFDDPAFGIEWPRHDGPLTISDKDRGYPDFVS